MFILNQKDILIISSLRNNARETLTNISKKTNVPISTIYDKLKSYEKSLIRKHTSLLDFNKLGFNARANIMIKVDRSVRDEIKDHLIKHQNINSVYKINNGFDFLIEGIFKNMKDLEDFMENLEDKFQIKNKQIHYIIDDIKRESFMGDPLTFDLVK